jgi:hypothetical protein
LGRNKAGALNGIVFLSFPHSRTPLFTTEGGLGAQNPSPASAYAKSWIHSPAPQKKKGKKERKRKIPPWGHGSVGRTYA